eukprot:TRINITY_DN22328_c0_g1_i1.p1 TRINITY_DN22328_c0_g1~~TRINITY_DN22328_c0_g1_i1.p1  ORF type:complete len:253 (+),score=60.86 TRINITY_DN22328_c0_g1_i1:57-815(+)
MQEEGSKKSNLKEQQFEYFLILDYEATCEKDKRTITQEIIEWPTCLLNAKTLEVEDEFQRYCRPTLFPQLTDFCTELTGITQKMVDEGDLIQDVWKAYREWLISKGLIDVNDQKLKTFAFVTCGDWDLRTMLPLQFGNINKTIPTFMREWVNIKKEFNRLFPKKRAGGMPSLLAATGLKLEGRHHSGIDDCRNITRVLQVMLRDGGQIQLTTPSPTRDTQNPSPNTNNNNNNNSNSNNNRRGGGRRNKRLDG